MLRLALPLVLAEVGWMSMGIVDTIMVGHMANPALAISACALGQVLYNTIAFGIAGVLLGLDTYLAQSHGAGRFDEANRWLYHGLHSLDFPFLYARRPLWDVVMIAPPVAPEMFISTVSADSTALSSVV